MWKLAIVILMAASSAGICEDTSTLQVLTSLIETERAFARTSVQKGIRASFLEFLAEDAVVFQPHPVRYREAIQKQPAPADPLAATLDWTPIYGDVSAEGDLGYDFGP